MCTLRNWARIDVYVPSFQGWREGEIKLENTSSPSFLIDIPQQKCIKGEIIFIKKVI